MANIASMTSVLGRLTISIIIAVVFCGCSLTQPRVAMDDVSRSGWSEQIDVVYNNQDTTSLCDMNVALRLGHGFSSEQLPLHIVIVTPDSLRYEESVTLPIDVELGEDNLGSVEAIVPYRKNVHLDRMGLYGFSITPEREIVGIEAVGIMFD